MTLKMFTQTFATKISRRETRNDAELISMFTILGSIASVTIENAEKGKLRKELTSYIEKCDRELKKGKELSLPAATFVIAKKTEEKD